MTQAAQNLEFQIFVLGYQEEGEWCAHALNMDLRGYGKTFEDAFDELKGCVECHIETALEDGEPETIFFSAENHYWQLFFEQATKDKSISASHKFAQIHIPAPHTNMSHVVNF